MRLPAFVLLGALLVGAVDCAAASDPAAAVATTAVRHVVDADDGHTLALRGKTPPSPRGAILLLHGRTWSALPNFDLQSGGNTALGDGCLRVCRLRGVSTGSARLWHHPARRQRLAHAQSSRSRRACRGHANPPPAPGAGSAGGGWLSDGLGDALFTVQQHPQVFSKLLLYGFAVDHPAGVQLRAGTSQTQKRRRGRRPRHRQRVRIL